jgi:hypothetical protein
MVTSYGWPKTRVSVSLLYSLLLPHMKTLHLKYSVQNVSFSRSMKNVLHLMKYQSKYHTFSKSPGQAWAKLNLFPILLHLSLILFTEVPIPFCLNLILVWWDFVHSGQKLMRLSEWNSFKRTLTTLTC